MKTNELKKLLPHLQRTIDAIEDLLQSGLTTASEATTKTFGVTFQEASRLKLLRLGSTLRSTHQEIGRYVNDDAEFSQTRLTFFLHRSWLLCKGLQHAIECNDDAQVQQLLWTPPSRPVEKLRVVCLGVVKKVAAENFCAFEFRLRELDNRVPLSWSVVFPLKKGNEIPAEGFLHLPQKQQFQPSVFTQGKVVEIEKAVLSDAPSGTRIQLTDASKVAAAEPYDQWERWLDWSVDDALEQLVQHQVSPFDVDVELQHEVCFGDYVLESPETRDDPPRQVWPLTWKGNRFELTVADGDAGKATVAKLVGEQKRLKSDKPSRPLFGLMHYSLAKLIVQPLAIYDASKKRMEYITLSNDAVDRKALLRALKF